MHRQAMGPLFGTEPLPNSVTIDNLSPSSVIIVHSALVHGRRKRAGGEGHPRYFTDISYCQRSTEADGRRWPAYQVFHGSTMEGSHAGAHPTPSPSFFPTFCARLVTYMYRPLPAASVHVDINAHLSQGRGGSDGRYDFVFDASTFYTADDATPAQLEALAGHGKRPPKKQPAVRSGD